MAIEDLSVTQKVCYSQENLEKLAAGLQDRDLCRKELAARDLFISEAKLNVQPLASWWQEPTMVVGGVVLSFAVGSLLTFYLVEGKK